MSDRDAARGYECLANRIPMGPNFLEYKMYGKPCFLHLECYRYGWVVCNGRAYGSAVSRTYPQKEDAWKFLKEEVERRTKAEEKRKSQHETV